MFEELQNSAEKLSARAASLQLACHDENKKRIIHYVEEIAFWSNAVLGDFLNLDPILTKEADNA